MCVCVCVCVCVIVLIRERERERERERDKERDKERERDKEEGRKEMFYITTHSTHFIYGYMASDIWLRTILIVRKVPAAAT